MIERPRKRHDAAQAHAAVRRLESGDAAVRRGNADAAAGIRAQRGEAVAHGDRGGRSARRPTGNALQIPRVSHWSPITHGGRSAGVELVQVRLADQDRARGFQPPDHLRVLGREAVFVNGAGGGGAHPGRIDAVLQADGNSMQRAADAPRRLLVRQAFCLCQRLLAHHRDPGVDFRIPGLDGIEAGLGEIDGREFFGPNTGGGLLEGEGAKIGGGFAKGESGCDGPYTGGEKVTPGWIWHGW